MCGCVTDICTVTSYCRPLWKWSFVILCFPEVVALSKSGDLYPGVWINFSTINSYQSKHYLSSQHKLL